MPVRELFPTLVYQATLPRRSAQRLNRELLRECRQVRDHDDAGRRWSVKNYPGGYTSYNSMCHMHRVSSTFAALEQRLNRHVRAFAEQLDYDLDKRRLVMTDCWINIMPRHAAHSLHLHPLSTISGTYYVRTPPGSQGLKLEDPRLDRYMAAPPRRAPAAADAGPWVTLPAKAGSLVLFESWLRHEVTANLRDVERVSISFNYNWF
jgi:uncharacterized protein (TIGR02466 family)